MNRPRFLAILLAVAPAASGCEHGYGCSEKAPAPDCASGLDWGACMERGGCWIRYYGGPGCQCRTLDSGKACARAGDCEGACVGDPAGACEAQATGACSQRRPEIGCFCSFDSAGRPGRLCVD